MRGGRGKKRKLTDIHNGIVIGLLDAVRNEELYWFNSTIIVWYSSQFSKYNCVQTSEQQEYSWNCCSVIYDFVVLIRLEITVQTWIFTQ